MAEWWHCVMRSGCVSVGATDVSQRHRASPMPASAQSECRSGHGRQSGASQRQSGRQPEVSRVRGGRRQSASL
jgi:hypothetical protein